MLRYSVPDMSCGHCVASITEAIHAVDPNAQVACDLAAKTVEVQASASSEALAQAIRTAGYAPVAT